MKKLTLRIGNLHTVLHGIPRDVAEQAMSGLGEELQARLARLQIAEFRGASIDALNLTPEIATRNADPAAIRRVVVDRLVEWVLSQTANPKKETS